MGEVYRAKDTRLERTVAIKVLPKEMSADAVRKQRFEREAKTISSLNHPNICTLHDIGSQEGVDYLVMECVEGETLAKRLEKGALPLEQVLKFGAQIADALDKAHRAGIVHRDLKPGNIMLTPTGAKLLDFGLAKPTAPLASAATLTAATPRSAVTEQGTILGTFQYMSPEQVEGKELDSRSDIFSLGVVLYEMVTGKKAFEGRSQLSVASAILEKEPAPIIGIKPTTPPVLDHALKKCLAKTPDERWQSAGDLASELKWMAESGSQVGLLTAGRTLGNRRERLVWLVATALALVLIGGGVTRLLTRSEKPAAMYFSASVPFAASGVAVSPDGKTAALVAYSDEIHGYAIWTYAVGGRRAIRVEGTENASHPFWSPDGKTIAFFADAKLKKVEAFTGRTPQVICDAPNGRGGTWNKDGVIVLARNTNATGLYKVPSTGGTPVEITTLDRARSEASHRWPVFLPDGKHFLYLAANFGGKFESNAIFAGSLDTQEKKFIVKADSNVAYAEPGYLFYWRDGGVAAQRFDARKLAVTSEPRTIVDGVQYNPQIDHALFGVASSGPLVVQTGKGVDRSQLTWFDRSGKQIGVVGPPGGPANPTLSKDGRRVAFEQTESDGRHVDIWVQDLASDAVARVTLGPGLNEAPVWSPDGKRIAYGTIRDLYWELHSKNTDGSGNEEVILKETTDLAGPWDWSRDGKSLLGWQNTSELWDFSWADRQWKRLFPSNWIVKNAQFSPDGKWVAYSTNETGNWEVFVSPLAGGENKWQVSRGGVEPRWRGDGKELFYLSSDRKMMSVEVKAGNSFEAGAPVPLFQTRLRKPVSAMEVVSYAVTGDGQRFLVNTRIDEPSAAPLSIILNWASEIER